MLFEDAVVLRKPVFARAVPIEEIVAISAGRHGVMFAWADGNTSTSTGVGEQGIIPNRLVTDLVSRILEARDAYLTAHDLACRTGEAAPPVRVRDDQGGWGWVDPDPLATGDRLTTSGHGVEARHIARMLCCLCASYGA